MHLLRKSLLFVLLALPLAAAAQAVPDPLQYLVGPETPGPNEAVRIEVQGVGSFLGNATITWTQDGAVTKTGVGERVYLFTTKGLGETTRVKVSIRSDTNGSFSKEFVFSPSLVNLIWEADTTVPPFYLGKSLYSAGSPLKIVAFPVVFSGKNQISPKALSYQWTRGEDPAPEASGLGRSSFSFLGDQLHTEEQVSVEVYYGAAKMARGDITIPAVDPKVLFYPHDALGGTHYERALPGAIQLNATELTLEAASYYFSNVSKKANQLSFAWTLNGESTTGPDAGRGFLTLRQAGAGVGSAAVGVTVQNNDPEAFIQQAVGNLQIIFGQQNSSIFSSFFGL